MKTTDELLSGLMRQQKRWTIFTCILGGLLVITLAALIYTNYLLYLC